MNRTLAAGLAGACLLAASSASWAQNGNPAVLSNPGFGAGKSARERAAASRQPAPPALPGARAEPTAVAPAERAAADMAPNDALFDAINRGDLSTAKDAIARGADLNGTNVLGLTPLELAVDLGRNDISFLLLSLRGGAGYNTAGQPQTAAVRAPSRAERLAAERAERAAQRQAAASLQATAPRAAPQTPRRFAGDGGAPAPQAGFLGFDSDRPYSGR
ncbi:MAG: hypothetical protein NVSMB18_13170 [Acetobacteraceae bacterium]